jgi:UDP-N-acetylglucosamine 2-epimerase (non-hydrolysing)
MSGGATIGRRDPRHTPLVSTILHVVGARPNFMKAAPVVRAMRERGMDQQIVHTGQHYDPLLSDVFFTDLGLPEPDINLGIGSGSHAAQTAATMVALEGVFAALEPALVVVYGDVNSTLAAAVVAAKLGTPLAHVEAGLRSFDDTMPEEINRRVTDLLSTLLFVTAPEGIVNLEAVDTPLDRIRYVGNPMIDTLIANLQRLDPAPVRARLGLDERYAVSTIHRPSNVDTAEAATRTAEMLAGLASQIQVLLPLHPRGREALARAGLTASDRLRIVDPLGYLDFMSLVRGARLVVTDSGGLQEETTFLGIACLTVRPNTERPVTISHGTNRLVEHGDVAVAARAVLDGDAPRPVEGPPLWDGHAGERIADEIAAWLSRQGG